MTKRATQHIPTLAETRGIAPDPSLLQDDAPEWFKLFALGFDLVGWTHAPCDQTVWRWARTVDPRNSRLMVIASGMTEADGKRWVHISYSRPTRMPSYDDLCLVKDRFIGADRRAISVHPPRSEHVSLHAWCLHLWHCIDDDGLPDFRHAGTI